jgi:hypothetical protein
LLLLCCCLRTWRDRSIGNEKDPVTTPARLARMSSDISFLSVFFFPKWLGSFMSINCRLPHESFRTAQRSWIVFKIF